MALEIERKFIVKNFEEAIKNAVSSSEICQAYLSDNPDCVVRLRIKDNEAFLTVKSRNVGSVRHEWEFQIPVAEGKQMFDSLTALPRIIKTRYNVPLGEHLWEIDRFRGALEGLVLAEIEMPAADTQITLPDFIEREVTDDPRYFNSNLVNMNRVPE